MLLIYRNISSYKTHSLPYLLNNVFHSIFAVALAIFCKDFYFISTYLLFLRFIVTLGSGYIYITHHLSLFILLLLLAPWLFDSSISFLFSLKLWILSSVMAYSNYCNWACYFLEHGISLFYLFPLPLLTSQSFYPWTKFVQQEINPLALFCPPFLFLCTL